MAKNKFDSGLDTVLGNIKPSAQNKTPKATVKENNIRATFVINEDLLKKLKGMAYWDRVSISETLSKSIESTIKAYEKKNGKIEPAPKK